MKPKTSTKLVEKRFGKTKDEQIAELNHPMTTIRNDLTPKQREFWWKTAHRVYMTNDRAHKYMVSERGRTANVCKMCNKHKETWQHMEYGCEELQKWLDRLEQIYNEYVKGKEADEWKKPTQDEWRLKENTEMSKDKMMVIAIARWQFHKGWCAINYGTKRRIDVERLAERVEETLPTVREREKRRREEKERQDKERDKQKTDEKENKKRKRGTI